MALVVTASKNHLPKIFYLCKSYISCYIYIDDKAQTLNKNRGSPAEEPIRRTDWTKAGWQNNHRAQHRESGKNSLDWRRDFIKTYPERDIPIRSANSCRNTGKILDNACPQSGNSFKRFSSCKKPRCIGCNNRAVPGSDDAAMCCIPGKIVFRSAGGLPRFHWLNL